MKTAVKPDGSHESRAAQFLATLRIAICPEILCKWPAAWNVLGMRQMRDGMGVMGLDGAGSVAVFTRPALAKSRHSGSNPLRTFNEQRILPLFRFSPYCIQWLQGSGRSQFCAQ
jgi:hypothetical protein